ncbi:MAG: nucleotide-diphospho-sugar transferase [Pedobacter sp.]|nr:MAG: nucleotide-diphospho-sugar transferase [Pedobacter sp.]
MSNYQTKSPVLLLIFNRPDLSNYVFEQIRAARPPKLYIAADGPRAIKENEKELCEKARQVVDKVDWACELKTLFRTENMGCKEAVSSAIDWFFKNEEEGIILEDDCFPASSFFSYCDELLEKYRHDTRIRHIGGSNLQLGTKWGDGSIFFSNSTAVWGWASWRRVWRDYDKNLTAYNEHEIRAQFSKIFNDRFVIDSWVDTFNALKANKIDTWDFQLTIINYLHYGLSINPNVSLIKNIGYRPDATHTHTDQNIYENIPLEEMHKIVYPKFMLPEKQADYDILKREFSLEERWRKHNLLRRRFKRWLKGIYS